MLKVSLKGDRKNLLANFLSLSVLQVIGYVFSLLTLPYLARVLGAENFGKIAFATAVISYFQCVVQWGFRYSAVRDIAVAHNDKNRVSQISSRVLCSSLFLMIFSFLILFILTFLIPVFKEERIVILVTALIIPGYTFFPDWLFQGMEKMKYITLMSLCSKVIFTLLIFIFITKPEHYVIEPALQALGQVVPGVIALVYGVKKFELRLSFVGLNEILETLKEGFNVFFTQFMPTIYNQLSIVLLGAIGGQSSVGIFSAAYKFIGISEQFAAVLSRTFYPFLARRIDKHKVFAMISGSISLCVSLVLLICSDIIIELFFTVEYNDAKTILRILSFGPFFLFLRNTYGMNGLVLLKKDKIYKNIIFFCSVLGFVLALASIPLYGNIGVAITFMVAWCGMGIASFAKYKKYENG